MQHLTETGCKHLLSTTLKLKMKKIWPRKLQRTPRQDIERPLLKRNSNVTHGYNKPSNGCTSAQDNFQPQWEQSESNVTPQELAELLGVAPDPSRDGSGFSLQPDTSSGQHHLSLIQRSVAEHFPEPPANMHHNLQQHLLSVQETLCKQLVRQRSLLENRRLMGCLIDCYHLQTFGHLSVLLQNTCSAQNCLLLMKWVLQTYLSQELLGHPDLQDMDPMNRVDMLLLTEWVEEAREKLLKHVQREVRRCLEEILQIERTQRDCDHEEACVGLYVDTIQCIEAIPKEAQKISSTLSANVREVCFQELLNFVKSFTTEQTELLKEEAIIDKPQILQIFKTLKTCNELKQHVRTKSKDIRRSLLQEIVATLEKMEGFILKSLKKLVSDFTKRHLESYFTAENKQFFLLMFIVKTYFPRMWWCQDIHKRVMDEVYKVIAHTYLQCLVQVSRRKLTKRWSPDVGQTIAEDAELLHETISVLAPSVQQWNLMLLKIKELLDCDCTDAVTRKAGSMQSECPTWREDMDLLPALLRWKGLSRCHVREVLDALSKQQPRPRSRSVFWLCCCAD